jgi:hypothetical protein
MKKAREKRRFWPFIIAVATGTLDVKKSVITMNHVEEILRKRVALRQNMMIKANAKLAIIHPSLAVCMSGKRAIGNMQKSIEGNSSTPAHV